MFRKLRRNMKWIIVFVCVAFVATLLYTGYSLPRDEQAQAGAVVAKVNGEKIERNRYYMVLRQYLDQQEQYGSVSPDTRLSLQGQSLDQLIDYFLQVQEARRQRIKVNEKEIEKRITEIKKQFPSLAAFRQQLREMGLSERKLRTEFVNEQLAKNLEEEVKKSVRVTEADAARAYEQVHARHILIKAEKGKEGAAKKKAEEVLAKLKGGVDFAVLAKQYSDDPGSKDKGGDLGFFGRGQMVAPFEKAAFALKVGETSGLVKSDYGYHIIQVLARKEAKGKDFEKQKPQLLKQEKEKKGNEAWTQLMDDLRRKAKIEVLDPGLAAWRLWKKENKPKVAIAAYEEALRKAGQNHPDAPYWHVALARLYEEQKQPQKALAEMEKAARLAGDYDGALQLALAQSYVKAKKNDKALAAMKKASEMLPKDMQAHYTLYNLYNQLQLKDKAQAEYQLAMKLYQEQMAKQQAAQKRQAKEKEQTQKQTKKATTGNPQGKPAAPRSKAAQRR